MSIYAAARVGAMHGIRNRVGLPRKNSATMAYVLAVIDNRPFDADVIQVMEAGYKPDRDPSFALMKRSCFNKQAEIHYNKVGSVKPDYLKEFEAKNPIAKQFRSFAFPGADVMKDTLEQTRNMIMRCERPQLVVYNNRVVGLSSFSRAYVDVITDDVGLGKFLGDMLSVCPKSAQYPTQEISPFIVYHHSSPDPEAGGVDAYVMFNHEFVLSRGRLPSYLPILDAIAGGVANKMLENGVLYCKGQILLDKNDNVVLGLGGDFSGQKDFRIVGNHHFAWGQRGVSRLWEGSAGPDNKVTLLKDSSVTFQPPKKIIMLSKGKMSGSGKSVAPGDAFKAVESACVVSGESSAKVFNKLIQGKELVVFDE